MDIVKLLLERLLSWPAITFLALLIFRKPLTQLLDRVTTLKAGKEGVSLDTSIAAVANQEKGLRTREAEERLKVVQNVATSPSVQQREERIRADLRQMNLDNAQQETVDLLIRQLAVTQAIAAAEQIYRTIFGSQIALLKAINTGGGTAPRAALEAVYEVAKGRFPNLYPSYSFEQWVNYLLAQGLLSTNDNEQFSITIDGIEFLRWITAAAVREDKPF